MLLLIRFSSLDSVDCVSIVRTDELDLELMAKSSLSIPRVCLVRPVFLENRKKK
jgi:hypothetical protein